MTECPGLIGDCRKELISLIGERPTIRGIIAIISIPVAVLGVIVLLVTLLYGKSVEINAMNVQAVSRTAEDNKDINSRQDERIRVVENNQIQFNEQVKNIASSVASIRMDIKSLNEKTIK